MPTITDSPPPQIALELAELRSALDAAIPTKALDRNLLIATWNIRALGDLTEKWKSDPGDSPQRDLHALRCIAEIISRFDVIALQEVRANLKALRHTLKLLGSNWGLILTDVTRGSPGNGERMAFLFDTRKVRLSGLASELVVPQEQLDSIAPDALEKQFARTPLPSASSRAAGPLSSSPCTSSTANEPKSASLRSRPLPTGFPNGPETSTAGATTSSPSATLT